MTCYSFSEVKRELQYGSVMDGGDTTSSQETTQRNGDDGQVQIKTMMQALFDLMKQKYRKLS